MTYEEYIASPEWATKREARLALDGHRCRLCGEDGSRYRLEVHHKPTCYQKIPNESVEDDLITVCSRCHELITDVIRRDRYERHEPPLPDMIVGSVSERPEVPRKELPQPDVIQTEVAQREEIAHGMANSKLQIDIISPVDNAQRTNGRPTKQVVKVDETDIIQARKDRRGP